MITRLGNILLIVALFAAMGGHWALLQSLAWAQMLGENLRTESLAQAVHKTFDGQHPCCLCKRISAGKSSEKKSEFPASLKRLEFVSKLNLFVFVRPSKFDVLPEGKFLLQDVGHEPPTPPPRALLG